ncbi:MAG: S1C family serine protease [Christensenellales bacterium]
MKTNRFWTVLFAIVLSISLALGLGSSMLASPAQGTLTADQVDAIVNTTTDQTKVTSPFIEIARNAQQSVVGVNNYQTRRVSQFGYNFGFPFEQRPDSSSQERKAGTGSGTVISPYGHVLTNYHVIEDATRTSISVGERELDATIVGSDSDLDIAVLLVPGLDLPAVPLGDSDAIQVGEYAIVIGNPLGQQFERSVSLGVVSAVSRIMTSTGRDRYGLRTETKNSMIQVDAAISSGNSGGGLFNTLGQLQGIPTLKLVDGGIGSFFSSSSYSVDNIGMCVPINVAKPLIRSVLESYDAQAVEAEAARVREEEARKAEQAGKPRPRIGVKIDTVGRYLPASQGIVPQGAFIAEVEKNSPAQVAGLKVGDIIVEADDEIITTQTQLIEKLQTLKEGDYVQLKVYRVTGLLDALQNSNRLSDLGKGEYLDIKVQLLVLDKTDM